MIQTLNMLAQLVSRAPARVQAKLLAAFLAIVTLLIIEGAAALYVLNGVNQHTQEVIKLQRKIEAYRQVQHDMTSQLYSVSSALISSDDLTLSSTLRQLSQFGYDVDRLEFVAKDEVELLDNFRQDYNRFVDVVTQVVELIRSSRSAEARETQLQHASPLADRLQRLTNQLVNRAEADMVAGIEATTRAYVTAQWIVVGISLCSIALALGLGYTISWSLIEPVKEIEARLDQIAAGDFAQRVRVVSRDELGTLAANVNRMCEELGALYHQIQSSSKHKSQFLANMSHELRTPLNAILGYTELILDNIYGDLPDQVRSVLERVQTNGRHLLGLINDVLDLSKIEAGQLNLSLAEYSLKSMIQTVYVAVESLATEKRLALKIDVSPDLPPGQGDERRLSQVLLNLVGNAIKFTDAGEVAIRARTVDGSFTVGVHDTGPGISEADQAKIFDEFQQGDTSTRKKGGTGLGLSIAKKIIEMHGGRLWVESTLGRGSTFSFTIPVNVDRQAGRAYSSAEV
jgi:signal transduction histidine kinase